MKEKFHVGLHVKDIEKTVDFYSGFLGKKPVKVKTDYAKFDLDNPALILTFNESPSHTAPGFGHLGIRVENSEELLSYRDKVVNLGHEIKEEKGTRCCYALQDKFWVHDPDGYEWEVFQFLEDVEQNEEQTACCS